MLVLSWKHKDYDRRFYYFMKNYELKAARKGLRELELAHGVGNAWLDTIEDTASNAKSWMFRDLNDC